METHGAQGARGQLSFGNESPWGSPRLPSTKLVLYSVHLPWNGNVACIYVIQISSARIPVLDERGHRVALIAPHDRRAIVAVFRIGRRLVGPYGRYCRYRPHGDFTVGVATSQSPTYASPTLAGSTTWAASRPG